MTTRNSVHSFCFMGNYMDVAAQMPIELQDKFLASIVRYVMCDEEPDFNGDWALSSAFTAIRPSLDKSKKLSRNRSANCEECAEKSSSSDTPVNHEVQFPPLESSHSEEKSNGDQMNIKSKSNENQNSNFAISVSASDSTNKSLGKGGVGEKPFVRSDLTLLNDALMDYWNRVFADTPVPKITRMTKKRQVGIHQRQQDHYDQKQLFEAIDKARTSSFLTGDNKAGWTINFDWLFCFKGNIQKVLEGNYDNRGQPVSKVERLLGAARADPKMSIWFGNNDPPGPKQLKGDST